MRIGGEMIEIENPINQALSLNIHSSNHLLNLNMMGRNNIRKYANKSTLHFKYRKNVNKSTFFKHFK
jgi:hypothetical protein